MLRTYRGIIQTRRDRVRGRYLPGLVLEHVRVGALQDARRSATEARSVLAEPVSVPAGLHADQLNLFVFEEIMENSDGIRTPTNAGDNRIR